MNAGLVSTEVLNMLGPQDVVGCEKQVLFEQSDQSESVNKNEVGCEAKYSWLSLRLECAEIMLQFCFGDG